MDHQELESQLRGRPSDASVWEAYSHWLTQTGDPRGQLIRLSQLRARTPADSARHAELGKELEPLAAACSGLVTAIPKGAEVDWQYGFVTGLQLRLTDGAASALRPFLASPHSCLLRSLRFTPQPPDGDEELEDEELDDIEGPVSPDTPPEPKLAGAAVALAELDLRNLRMLALPYCPIGSEGATRLLSAPQLGRLLSLDLRYAYIADKGLQALVGLPQLAGLRSLWLQRNALTAKGAQALASSPHLRELRLLDLRYNRIGAKGAQALAASPVVRELKVLHLYRHEVKKAGTEALASSPSLPLALRRVWRAS